MSHPKLAEIFARARSVIDLATRANMTIATAESCTGGLIWAAITSINGSSQVFKGGIIAYDNEVKAKRLNVAPDLINDHGAVSAAVAKAMAIGAYDQIGVDIAISVTGVAGPTGGTIDKPVGTVWMGLAANINQNLSIETQGFNFGDIGRNKVRDATVFEALKKLELHLR